MVLLSNLSIKARSNSVLSIGGFVFVYILKEIIFFLEFKNDFNSKYLFLLMISYIILFLKRKTPIAKNPFSIKLANRRVCGFNKILY